MRKLILLILASTLLCSAARAETLVVWFSCTGNTEALAHTAAGALNADLWQLSRRKRIQTMISITMTAATEPIGSKLIPPAAPHWLALWM